VTAIYTHKNIVCGAIKRVFIITILIVTHVNEELCLKYIWTDGRLSTCGIEGIIIITKTHGFMDFSVGHQPFISQAFSFL